MSDKFISNDALKAQLYRLFDAFDSQMDGLEKENLTLANKRMIDLFNEVGLKLPEHLYTVTPTHPTPPSQQ